MSVCRSPLRTCHLRRRRFLSSARIMPRARIRPNLRAALSHPESIAFGFVSSHPRWRAHPACGIQRIGRSAESVCLAVSTCVGAPICRASGTHLAVLLTLLCGCGNTSRWRTGDRHSHTNENNPPTTPTTIAAFVPNCSPSTPPRRPRAFPKPQGLQSDSLERVRADSAVPRLAPRSRD